MGSINKSHNEADGGILLFNGELILLYCDSVGCEIGNKESFKGRVYLTTHRLVVVVTPYRQNLPVKSLCAPFCAITKCSVEQPIFGANYIEATVRDESDNTKSFSFKMRFSKGGAIEFAMAMNRAVSAVGRNFNPANPPPPAYTPSPSAQYYQAPPNVYAPGYNTGVPMPLQQFPDQPPIGFIYASSAPPPYPGLGGGGVGGGQAAQPPPPYSSPQQQGGPHAGPTGYPQQSQGGASYPNASGFPQHGNLPGSQPSAGQGQGYPTSQGGYPGVTNPSGGYPPQAGGYPSQAGGYPTQPGGYPTQTGGYPQQQQSSYGGYPQPGAAYPPGQSTPQSGGYPDLTGAGIPSQQQPGAQPQPAAPSQEQQQQGGGSAWPTAPSFNPNWQDDKKSS